MRGRSVPTDRSCDMPPPIHQVLAASEGQAVPTALLRNGMPVLLMLTPQRWAGRGLLGCHLQPL